MYKNFIASLTFILLVLPVKLTLGKSTEAIPPSTEQWSRELVLKDYLNFIDYDEQLIHFPVKFPGTFPADEVVLRLGDKIITHQLTDVIEKDGKIVEANVWFRTALNRKEEKIFIVEQSSLAGQNEIQPDIVLQNQDGNLAVIETNKLSIKVPWGNQRIQEKLSDTPSPFISFSRNNEDWIGNGRFTGTADVDSVVAGITESGPLFLKYRISYFLSGNKKYMVDLTAYQFEDYITVDEYPEGFSPGDDINFIFSYKQGLSPNGRLALEKAGYETGLNGVLHSGAYNEDVNEEGELPYQLGQYHVVNAKVVASTTFWNDDGENALSLACYRLADWKTYERHIWNIHDMPDNIRFYQSDTDQFMKIPVVGNERHWAIKIFPRDEVRLIDQYGNETWYANSGLNGLDKSNWTQSGADPAVRLLKRLNGLSLQWTVNTTFEWDEDINAVYNQEGEFQTFEEFKQNKAYQLYKNKVCDIYWEAYRSANSIAREQDELMSIYAKSRSRWTEDQRKEIRAFFLHYIYSEFYDDIWAPNRSMIGGHPNFMMEDLYSSYTALFPNHPDVLDWKERYLDFFNEYKKVYITGWDKSSYALGGRHTENIACYSYASMRGLIPDYLGLMDFDGTNLLDDPKVKDWLRWHMYGLVTPVKEYACTYTPPQGAHAREREKKNNFEFFGQLEKVAEYMHTADPELSEHLLWALTKGEKGKKPDLESAIFNDYGAILRYDFGGPDEAYLNIQELGVPDKLPEGYNTAVKSLMYRWRTTGNGILYYAAKDTIWSWNGVEDNGDHFDIEKCPVFIVNGNGLENNTGHGILYNFDWAQFYRATGSNPDYLSRDVMMIKNDFVAVYDNVASDFTEGKFNWVNFMGKMPFIHTLQTGPGDNLHIVESGTEEAYAIKGTSFPAILENDGIREYLFMADENSVYGGGDSIAGGSLKFDGRSAYASLNKLAVFEGDLLSLNGAALGISGGNFGASAVFTDKDTIRGRISGRSGGVVKILPPPGFNYADKEVHIIREKGIEKSSLQRLGDTILIDVELSAGDGYYIKYSIVPAGTPPEARPHHPALLQDSYKINQDIAVSLRNPDQDTVLVNPGSLLLEASVEADTIRIDRVEFYMNDHLIGTAVESPWRFNWEFLPEGECKIFAKAISENNEYNQSGDLSLTISDGSPRVEIQHPEEGQSWFVIDTIHLSAFAEDYDGSIDSVSFYANNEFIGSAFSDPYQFEWTNPAGSAYKIVAKAYDDSGKESTSPAVNIHTIGFLKAANPDPVAPGMIREYYEGSWNQQPDLSGSVYLQKDCVSNFYIQDHQREDGYAFRFEGFLKIGEKGKYEFYTVADDGCKLTVGEKLIGEGPGPENQGVVLLDSGLYKIELAMFDYAGPQTLRVGFTRPDGIRQEIPDSLLFHSAGNAPQISILHPLQNAFYNEEDSLDLRVSASDENNDIYRIDYYDGEELIDSVSENRYLTHISSLTGGDHVFTAVANDLSGMTNTSQPVAIWVNPRPKIKIMQPEALTELTGQDPVNVVFTVEDDSIHDVKIFLNGLLAETLEKSPWKAVLPPQKRGSYYLKVRATDIHDLQAEDRTAFSVVNVPPAISIIKPDSGAIFQKGEIIQFQASVADPDDDVYKVAFYSENTQIGPNAGSLLYNTSVSNLSSGVHTIKAKAFDKAGAVTVSEPISITVTDLTYMNDQNNPGTISIYPNPLGGGSLNIKIEKRQSGFTEAKVMIKDVFGRVVYLEKQKFSDGYLSLPSEIFTQDGIYFLSVHFLKEVLTEKIIVTAGNNRKNLCNEWI